MYNKHKHALRRATAVFFDSKSVNGLWYFYPPRINEPPTHTHTHTSAVPEHGPTLTGPTPSLELTASHEPKENKFYQTAIAIRMNSLKDIFFWFLDFFVNVVFFFLLDSWAFKTVMFFCTAKRRNAHWSPKPSEFSMANSNDCSLEMIPRHKTVPVFRPIL